MHCSTWHRSFKLDRYCNAAVWLAQSIIHFGSLFSATINYRGFRAPSNYVCTICIFPYQRRIKLMLSAVHPHLCMWIHGNLKWITAVPCRFMLQGKSGNKKRKWPPHLLPRKVCSIFKSLDAIWKEKKKNEAQTRVLKPRIWPHHVRLSKSEDCKTLFIIIRSGRSSSGVFLLGG